LVLGMVNRYLLSINHGSRLGILGWADRMAQFTVH